MTDTASDLAPQQGKFGRVPVTGSAFVQSLATSSLDLTFDRMVGLAFAAACAFLRALERVKTGITAAAVDKQRLARKGPRRGMAILRPREPEMVPALALIRQPQRCIGDDAPGAQLHQ
ncbi:hypothetical protein GCM10011611_47840 [Aliidongia dinghuensis]|uniref:Uncharacterized protein n=1 Tax=Aliidongia dinghuensis TaxID=1867774 RepID=A0A8J3E5W6_9PROT|nr:hypothetical protein [Aliidongia dinghuensis]GGF35925.1 hypothetical protein GCM10011611_47840 [Aliidongia dinghuensis]